MKALLNNERAPVTFAGGFIEISFPEYCSAFTSWWKQIDSNFETFSSICAEALACGKPVLATRCGGPEEFVNPDDGIMVEPDNPAAFAEGIMRAVQLWDTFRADDIRSRIVKRFGRAAWREQAMAIYERVAVAGLRIPLRPS